MKANGIFSRNEATTKRAYKMALEKVGGCLYGRYGITMKPWIECLKNPDTTQLIEENVGLKLWSFKRGRKGKRRKENTYHPRAHTTELLYSIKSINQYCIQHHHHIIILLLVIHFAFIALRYSLLEKDE